MTTTIDLGEDVTATWACNKAGDVIGAAIQHPTPHGPCTVTVFWADPPGGGQPTHVWAEVEQEGLAIQGPPIACPLCGTVGEVTSGRWVRHQDPS